MTRGEAIQILSTRDAHGVLCGYTSGVTEALDMAIEALSTDTVSREEYEEVKAYMDTLVDAFIEDGKELAESVKVVRCKDCRYCTEYYDRDGYPYWECVEWDGGTNVDGFCHYGERREE